MQSNLGIVALFDKLTDWPFNALHKFCVLTSSQITNGSITPQDSFDYKNNQVGEIEILKYQIYFQNYR
jgi:hypothetical protein